MRWLNVNMTLRVKVNSGAALILFLASFFLLLLGVAFFPAIATNFIAAGGILVGAFGGYLRKEHANNQLDLEAAKANVVDAVSTAKQAALARAVCGDQNAVPK